MFGNKDPEVKVIQIETQKKNFIQYLLAETLTLQRNSLCNFKSENFYFSKYEIFWHNLSLYFRSEIFLEIIFKDEFLNKLINSILNNFEVFLVYLINNFQEINQELSNNFNNSFLDKNSIEQYKTLYINNVKKIIQAFYKIMSFGYDKDYIYIENYRKLVFKVYEVFEFTFNMKSIVEYTFTKWGQAKLSFDGSFCKYTYKFTFIL